MKIFFSKILLPPNKLFLTSIYSLFVFSTISFMSIMYSLLSRKGTDHPVANIGFPFSFYDQFWMKNNDLHWGWDGNAFIADFLFVWIIIYLIYFIKLKLDA